MRDPVAEDTDRFARSSLPDASQANSRIAISPPARTMISSVLKNVIMLRKPLPFPEKQVFLTIGDPHGRIVLNPIAHCEQHAADLIIFSCSIIGNVPALHGPLNRADFSFVGPPLVHGPIGEIRQADIVPGQQLLGPGQGGVDFRSFSIELPLSRGFQSGSVYAISIFFQNVSPGSGRWHSPAIPQPFPITVVVQSASCSRGTCSLYWNR